MNITYALTKTLRYNDYLIERKSLTKQEERNGTRKNEKREINPARKK